MKNDEQWMLEYQGGSEEAFVYLYEKYSPLVWSFIKKRMRESEANDLYQKVWQRLHEKRDLYHQAPFAPWFFVMIRHLLIDEYRYLGRKKNLQISDEFIEKVYAVEKSQDVEELLQILPPESQKLVRQYYLEGVSYEELQLDTGLSQTNLRQRLSRALKKMRKAYEK